MTTEDNSCSSGSNPSCPASPESAESASPTPPQRAPAQQQLSARASAFSIDSLMTKAKTSFQQHRPQFPVPLMNLRMFPVVRVSFSGLDPEERYHVVMDIVSVDKNRYRYAYHRSAWMVAGKGDPELPQRLYIHPDSPFTGDQLMKQTVSFEKLKLTNNVLDKHYIVLNSMHKYQPRVHLLRVGQATGAGLNPGSGHVSNFAALQSLDQKKFQFPETVFIAVTAYQNQLKKRSAPTLSEKRGNLLQKLEKGLRGWAGAGRAAPNWANQ
uniref:T-box domain-containing protein n=1 Tax=Macrostomum lignano TaxID=282301 RepID=A0A1I8IW74_9PLAT